MMVLRLLLFTVLITSCMPERTQECLGSNECDSDRVCRAGLCVRTNPAAEPIRDSGSTYPDTPAETPRESDTDAIDAQEDVAPSDATDGDADVDTSPCPGAVEPEPGDLRINELMANPPPDELGDSNRDGTRDAFEDEFVEVVNVTDEQLDLTRTRLFVSGTPKSLFSGLCLPPGEGVVVFGGYRGPGTPVVARGSIARVSATRLGLSNAGGTVSLSRSDGTAVDSVSYSDAPAESLTRAPQLHGPDFLAHSALPGARLMSPGQCADGSILTARCPDSEPRPDAGSDPADAGD